jgi:prepilin-type N-terminal cleavage/methylation domain-containing protein
MMHRATQLALGRPIHHQRFARRGFSLIELIVVILLVSIMAAVAVPKMSNIGSTRAAVAARMIARDLTYARERAIATGTRSWVVFSAGTNSYSVLTENPASPGRIGANVMTDPNGNGRTFVQYLNANELVGVTMTSVSFDAGAEVGFDWVGKPYNSSSTALAAAGTIVLSNGFTITVQPTTGLAKVTP